MQLPYYPDLDLIYIHIPKTAGGAIEAALLPWKAGGQKTPLRRVLARLAVPQDPCAAYIPGHSTALWHKRVLGKAFDGARRFSVVRDPYDRAISAYEFIRQTSRHHAHRKVAKVDFTQFLRMRPLSQVPFLTGRDGRILVEHLVRFEDLPEGLDTLFAELGVPARLERAKDRNASAKQPRESYLTPQNVALINRACAADFRLLGYAMLPAGPRSGR